MSEHVAGYALSLPSPGQVCVSVMRVCREDPVGTWRGVCAQAQVPVIAPAYTLVQLDQISSVLTTRPGALSIVGRSWGVRLTSYRTLMRSAR